MYFRTYNTQCILCHTHTHCIVKGKSQAAYDVYSDESVSVWVFFLRQLTITSPCNLLSLFSTFISFLEQHDRCNKIIPFDKFYFRIIFTSGFCAWPAAWTITFQNICVVVHLLLIPIDTFNEWIEAKRDKKKNNDRKWIWQCNVTLTCCAKFVRIKP